MGRDPFGGMVSFICGDAVDAAGPPRPRVRSRLLSTRGAEAAVAAFEAIGISAFGGSALATSTFAGSGFDGSAFAAVALAGAAFAILARVSGCGAAVSTPGAASTTLGAVIAGAGVGVGAGAGVGAGVGFAAATTLGGGGAAMGSTVLPADGGGTSITGPFPAGTGADGAVWALLANWPRGTRCEPVPSIVAGGAASIGSSADAAAIFGAAPPPLLLFFMPNPPAAQPDSATVMERVASSTGRSEDESLDTANPFWTLQSPEGSMMWVC